MEDFEPFREFICTKLGENPELRVICQVSDGLEAVRKGEELQPDLVLLDVGLPTLNGIEAARQIRKLAPDSKIVFVSQECSADVVEEAFRLGAVGYVAKTDAGSDLPRAVSAALRGETFVSTRFADHDFTGVFHAKTRKASTVMRSSRRSNRRRTRSRSAMRHSSILMIDVYWMKLRGS